MASSVAESTEHKGLVLCEGASNIAHHGFVRIVAAGEIGTVGRPYPHAA